MMKAIILSLGLLVAGCGGDSGGAGGAGGSGGGSAGSGAAGTGGNGTDMAMHTGGGGTSGGFVCGSTLCGANTSCCVVGTMPMCSSSCPDGGFTAACAGPADCGSGNACCIKFAIAGSMVNVTDISCAAETKCVPGITGTDRACETDADCISGTTMSGLKTCCTLKSIGRKACFDKTLAKQKGFEDWMCPP